jgi:U6 snRNA-associated Sm-like protein LSm6
MLSPSDFLSSLIGASVKVRLTTGVNFSGILEGMDGSMNVALENAVEEGEGNKFEHVLLRGNNVLYVRAQK